MTSFRSTVPTVPSRLSVVAGIDGSGSAVRAAVWAGAEASRRGLPLRLVHVYTIPSARMPKIVPSMEAIREGVASRGREWLSVARKEVEAHCPGLVIEIAAREWNPVAALIQESLAAKMIVLGSRGLGGFTGLLVGSTAVALAQHGHCPIVVARGNRPDDPPPESGPIVVGTDGSPESTAAIAFAFDEAVLRGTGLTVVRTWSDVLEDGALRPHALNIDAAEIEAAEHKGVDEQLAPWRDEHPGVPLEIVVRRGRPVRTLLGFGERARLLVVGCRGRGGFQGMLLGSTSQALVAHSPCPVAVVRETTGKPGISPR